MIDLYIIPLGTEREALQLTNQLRKSGLAVDIEMLSRRLGKSLDLANRCNIPYVLVLGEEELESGQVKVKEMATGREISISLQEVGSRIKQELIMSK